jgi:hypothetical protein
MRRAGLIAAAALAFVTAEAAQVHKGRDRSDAPPDDWFTPPRRPTPPPRDTALQREIDDWNAAVDRRKAEKKRRVA